MCKNVTKSKLQHAPTAQEGKQVENAQDYPLVEPLGGFDWKKAELLQLRPFKPKYHLTMCTCNHRSIQHMLL